MSLLIVVPARNEAAHIEAVVTALLADAPAGTRLVVADGQSTDATPAIVARLARSDPRLHLMDNPRRLQAAGVNLAVERFGQGMTHLLRADAHADYPAGFVRALMQDMAESGAVAVTVGMETLARDAFTEGVAAAQNSRLGTGGSAHRMGRGGRFVDHGHHALMRLDAFRTAGGYAAEQSHNEDAELDHRLRLAGGRIWLSGRVKLGYHPRGSLTALFRQYRAHGRGRAMTVRKHGLRLKLRQVLPALVPLAVFAGAVGLVLAPLQPAALLLTAPALIWAAICLGYGTVLALRARRWPVVLAGPVAMAMHLGWGIGFLHTLLRPSESGPSVNSCPAP